MSRSDPPNEPPEAFRRFADDVGRALDLDLADAGPDALLSELGFDSLAMAELLVLLADRDVHLPEELVPALRTLGDAHHYATVLAPAVPAGVGGLR